MNILHICSYYIGSEVYKELITKIHKLNGEIVQDIYIPLRQSSSIGKNRIDFNNIKLHYRKIYNQLDRLFFPRKISKAFKDIQKQIDIKKINCIHAHTIFADGMLAYKLNKKFGIKYIVTVRNSDIYAYLKYMPFAKSYLKKIIKYASKVVFISPYMKKDLEKKLNKNDVLSLNEKSIIMPNGISDFWHENVNLTTGRQDNEILKFIQVSSLDKNKNLYATLKILKKLNDLGIKSELTVVGKRKL